MQPLRPIYGHETKFAYQPLSETRITRQQQGYKSVPVVPRPVYVATMPAVPSSAPMLAPANPKVLSTTCSQPAPMASQAYLSAIPPAPRSPVHTSQHTLRVLPVQVTVHPPLPGVLELGPQVTPTHTMSHTATSVRAPVHTETNPFFLETEPLTALSTTYGAPASLAGWESGDPGFTGTEYDANAMQTTGTAETGNQFNALLESLEARVDLMSQMQQTRAAIQRRARAIEQLQDGGGVAEDGAFSIELLQQEMQEENTLDNDTRDMKQLLQSLGSLAHDADPDATLLVGPVEKTPAVGPSGDASSSHDCFRSQHDMDATRSCSAEMFFTPPFSRETCGVNLTLSEDGYVAERTSGCRQSVAIGSGPLPPHAWGWFFEVEVLETVTGWVGGLGIGVTTTPPGQLRRVPDKAWRLPRSFIVGYWGCIFVDGQERRTAWGADSLCAGARVGVLVTNNGRGDLIVFVNQRPVVSVPGALAGGEAETPIWQEPLYPVVDVFAATRAVALSRHAVPPHPPWHVDESLQRPSPPVSPRSMCHSAYSATASRAGGRSSAAASSVGGN